MFSNGTRTSLNDISACGAPLNPILGSRDEKSNPGVPFSTIIWLTPLYGGEAFGSVWQQTMMNSAMSPHVMYVLTPLIFQLSPSFTAFVSSPTIPASEPCSGSVSAIEHTISPLHSLGMYFFFCSSVPYIGISAPKPTPEPIAERVESIRLNSSAIIAASTHPSPCPPYSSGMSTPMNPSSAAFL